MNLTEVLFLISFLMIIFITFFKIINIFNLGNKYSLGYSFIFFGLFSFSWLVVFITTSTMINNIVFFQLLRLSSWLFIPNVLFLFLEIFFNIKNVSVQSIKPYDPKSPLSSSFSK
jgi:hypothetical protein